MKLRLILIMLLVLSGGPAYAEWVRVGETDTYTGYIDPKTIRLTADFAKMWGLYDNKTAQSSSAVESYLSIKSLDEYDCLEKQTRNLGLHLYSDQMGKGKMLSSYTNPDKWKPVMPGSVGEVAWKLACGKK